MKYLKLFVNYSLITWAFPIFMVMFWISIIKYIIKEDKFVNRRFINGEKWIWE